MNISRKSQTKWQKLSKFKQIKINIHSLNITFFDKNKYPLLSPSFNLIDSAYFVYNALKLKERV